LPKTLPTCSGRCRAVVLDRHAEAVLALGRDLDRDLGQDPGLLAGVERVVDGFLDRR
jgi:hypothetical protein